MTLGTYRLEFPRGRTCDFYPHRATPEPYTPEYLPLFSIRGPYAKALYMDDAATLEDIREAVTTLEEIKPIAQRVLGGAYPTTTGIENNLRKARAKLRAQSKT